MSAYDLLVSRFGLDPAYEAKMLKDLEPWPETSREASILEFVKDYVVVDFGASGPMHAAIVDVAKRCYGVDAVPSDGVARCDLDDVSLPWLPEYIDVERTVCGEILEHLTNPGHFLRRLRKVYPVPSIISVPNAFSRVGADWIERGVECVNGEHVAYYSQRTLVELLRRTGWRIVAGAWYNGPIARSEGLIVVVEVA